MAAVKPDPWAGFTAEGSGGNGNSTAEYLGKTLDFFINNWHSGEHFRVCLKQTDACHGFQSIRRCRLSTKRFDWLQVRKHCC